MPWVKIDDRMSEHEKIASAGDPERTYRVSGAAIALTLQMRAIGYCARNLTDGRLPRGVVAMMSHDLGGFGAPEMVAARLWDALPDGSLTVHDYLDFNPSRQQVLGERQAAADRMQRVRTSRSSRNVRPNFGDPVPDPVPELLLKGPLPPFAGPAESGETTERARRPPVARPPAYTASCPPCMAILNTLNEACAATFNAPGRSGEWMHLAHEQHGVDRVLAAVERQRLKLSGRREFRRWMSPSVLFKPENFDVTVNDTEPSGGDELRPLDLGS